MQLVTILGSTGTIGQQTLDVINRHPQRYRVFALTAHSNVQSMFTLCRQYLPRFAVMQNAQSADELRKLCQQVNLSIEVIAGTEGLVFVSAHPDVHIVMAAIVGAAGLLPALAAAQAGKKILLANKETLVIAGQLFMDTVKQGGATLLPIDSEHNAIFQVMPKQSYDDLSEVGVDHVILTASGGPFRRYTASQLAQVTPKLALKHPNWVMGAKITIDSSTLMNKGLEVIEAHWLFAAKPAQIEVVIHPQSIIHSMVSYVDGSILAQLGNPDMRTPIAYGLAYPERITAGVKRLSLVDIAQLEFEAPDTTRFPCLQLAFDALQAGGTASAVLNAANEVAVAAFLREEIHYLDIPRLIAAALEKIPVQSVESVEQLLAVDAEARQLAIHATRQLKMFQQNVVSK